MVRTLRRLDRAVTAWLSKNGVHFLRVGLGIVFLWFGALKLFPGMSPAEGLIERTVGWIVDPVWFIPLLGLWECAIGVGLILDRFRRLALLLLFAHMPGTFMPLVVCPELVWSQFPFGWTLEGQYILKNLVLVGAGLTLCGRPSEGRVSEPAPQATGPEAFIVYRGAQARITSHSRGRWSDAWQRRPTGSFKRPTNVRARA